MEKNDTENHFIHPITRREALNLAGIAASGVLSSTVLGGCAKSAVTGKPVLAAMTEKEEREWDEEYGPSNISVCLGPIQDEKIVKYVASVGRDIAAASHRPNLEYTFIPTNAVFYNAFAFPGGTVSVTRGMLNAFDNESQLAAVLGHEIGHICARHMSQRVAHEELSDFLFKALIYYITKDKSSQEVSKIKFFAELGHLAMVKKFSRDNEREADALAIDYMSKAGYNPIGAVELQEILLRNRKEDPTLLDFFFGTHPLDEERIQNARRKIALIPSFKYPDNIGKERFMDEMASLRKNKEAITLMKEATEKMGKGLLGAADERLKAANKLMPDDYACLLLSAKCNLAVDLTKDAFELAKRAHEIIPAEPQAHFVMGMAALSLNKFEEALDGFGNYIKYIPRTTEMIFYQGYAMEGMNRKLEASDYYQSYLRKIKRPTKNGIYAFQKLEQWGFLPKRNRNPQTNIILFPK
ncbi:MAG: M48 family metalloprotease [Magnetococcales bacterium]|nr:M48 family metalloprotease [Magnetococcales bacterium]